MKSKNLIIVLIALLVVLSIIYFFASFDKFDKGGINYAPTEGINGYVVAGPVCLVQTEENANCGDKPIKANIVVKNKEDDVVKNIETLDDGSFSVHLSPGKYVIYNDSGGGLTNSKPEYVTVGAGNFAEVKIRIDAGTR